MKTKNLLTIGKLSKITGVHIKALRYYDSIGILPPAYVNPENGYRYYSYVHIYLVEAIRICAEMNIPLKQFKDFISEDGSQIQYPKLIELGTILAGEKMKKIQEDLNTLKYIKEAIERSERVQHEEKEQSMFVLENDYWLVPYDGKLADNIEYHVLLSETITKILNLGILPMYETGMILLCEKGKQTSFLFITLEKEETNKKFDNILHLPATSYAFKKTSNGDIHNAPNIFPQLFSKEYDKVVFELEIFPDNFDSTLPQFEIRCSLPNENL